MKNTPEKKSRSVKFSIGLRLIIIISVLVIVSLGTVTFLVSYFMGAELQVNTEESNFSATMKAATTVENELTTIRKNVFGMLDMFNAAGSSGMLVRQTSANFFERYAEIAAVVIPGNKNLVNSKFFVSNELEQTLVDDFLSLHSDEITRSENGESFVLNAAPTFGIPVLVMMCPWRDGGLNETAIIFFTSSLLSDTFGTGSASISFMINHDGDLLVHSDVELTKAGASMAKSPLVQIMRENNDENRQVLFTGEDGKEYFGSYCKISTADIGILTTIEKEVALKMVTNQTRLNIYLAIAVLFIAILFVFFYSKTLSKPLSLLTDIADEINQGNYDLTGLVHEGDNVISVKVMHPDIADCRWYTGSGIIRKVYLDITENVFVKTDGVFFSVNDIDDGKALVRVSAEIKNGGAKKAKKLLTHELIGADGKLALKLAV